MNLVCVIVYFAKIICYLKGKPMNKISYLLLLISMNIFFLTGCQSVDSKTHSTEPEKEPIVEYEKSAKTGINSDYNSGKKKPESSIQEAEEVSEEDKILFEKINKSKIDEQSFEIDLNNWGRVNFVSCMPDDSTNTYTDVSFYLTNDNKVLYQFPYVTQNNIRTHGICEGVSFVYFDDVNGDNTNDVVIGIEYYLGAGPQGMLPRTEVRIFEAEGDKFVYDKELCQKIFTSIEKDIVTAEDVKELLNN